MYISIHVMYVFIYIYKCIVMEIYVLLSISIDNRLIIDISIHYLNIHKYTVYTSSVYLAEIPCGILVCYLLQLQERFSRSLSLGH